MKIVLSFVGLLFVCVSVFVFGNNSKDITDGYLRIHIIANSNDAKDQEIKYDVKDEIIKFLSPKLKNTQNFALASQKIEQELQQISAVADAVLKNRGVTYLSNCFLAVEEIPTRAYDNLILKSGKYQTLIVKLGKAEGDNWWCVVFPNVCFYD